MKWSTTSLHNQYVDGGETYCEAVSTFSKALDKAKQHPNCGASNYAAYTKAQGGYDFDFHKWAFSDAFRSVSYTHLTLPTKA